jgi:hypothetical protein
LAAIARKTNCEEEESMKRLLLAGACICIFTVVSPTYLDRRTTSIPFPVAALAGHTGTSSYCEDGTPGCLPGDPGTSARPIRSKCVGKASSCLFGEISVLRSGFGHLVGGRFAADLFENEDVGAPLCRARSPTQIPLVFWLPKAFGGPVILLPPDARTLAV